MASTEDLMEYKTLIKLVRKVNEQNDSKICVYD